eukprot:3126373-Rhodomonas_salina.1
MPRASLSILRLAMTPYCRSLGWSWHLNETQTPTMRRPPRSTPTNQASTTTIHVKNADESHDIADISKPKPRCQLAQSRGASRRKRMRASVGWSGLPVVGDEIVSIDGETVEEMGRKVREARDARTMGTRGVAPVGNHISGNAKASFSLGSRVTATRVFASKRGTALMPPITLAGGSREVGCSRAGEISMGHASSSRSGPTLLKEIRDAQS